MADSLQDLLQRLEAMSQAHHQVQGQRLPVEQLWGTMAMEGMLHLWSLLNKVMDTDPLRKTYRVWHRQYIQRRP